ncbi:MAG: TIGR02646 family protein [bacterium]|nr:TIGR02646 family protein [bacterium]
MKYIEKKSEAQEFTQWKALANEDWQPAYSSLSGEIKQSVKSALMHEQGYICCYCEKELIDQESHIEHFRPQKDPLVDPLDFSNMLCSCQNNIAKGEPRHCGNLKGDWFDEDLLVSPLNSDCEKQFKYIGNGEIYPASSDNISAETTISKLGLNIPKLQDLRKKAIEPFLDDSLNEQELTAFVEGYLKQGSNDRFNVFHTTIQSIFT